MVILPLVRLCGANKNVAGTVHLKTLLDQDLLVAGGNSVRNHPGRAASPAEPVADRLRCKKIMRAWRPGFPIDSFAAKKYKDFPPLRARYSGGTVEIEPEFCAVSSERRATMVKACLWRQSGIGAESSKSVGSVR